MKTYIDYGNFILFNESFVMKGPESPNYKIILEELNNGKAELVPYTPHPPTWNEIRAQRDSLLKESDWIGASDAQPKPSKESWLYYRQALRDITIAYSKPEDVIWPQKPIA